MELRERRFAKWLVLEPSCGLGNRLRFLLSGLRLAEYLHLVPVISWTFDEHHLACPFEELFASNVQVLPIRETLLADPVRVLHYIPEVRTAKIVAFVNQVGTVSRSDLKDADVLVIQGANLVKSCEDSGTDEVLPLLKALFGTVLAPSKAIADKVEEFSRRFDLTHMCGVHVRRGDISECSPRYVRLESFYLTVDQLHTGTPLLLCTQSDEVAQAFSTRYAGRVFRLPVRSNGRIGAMAAQDALIELLLLSRCREIIAGVSSFSFVAHVLGGNGLMTVTDQCPIAAPSRDGTA